MLDYIFYCYSITYLTCFLYDSFPIETNVIVKRKSACHNATVVGEPFGGNKMEPMDLDKFHSGENIQFGYNIEDRDLIPKGHRYVLVEYDQYFYSKNLEYVPVVALRLQKGFSALETSIENISDIFYADIECDRKYDILNDYVENSWKTLSLKDDRSGLYPCMLMATNSKITEPFRITQTDGEKTWNTWLKNVYWLLRLDPSVINHVLCGDDRKSAE